MARKKQDDSIIVLSDREKVRENPGMYIGDDDQLGLDTIVREVIDNAVDEYANYADKTKPIEITLYDDNSLAVRDYGRGISPYESGKYKGKNAERLAFSQLGAGGKFKANRSANGNQFSGGMHGVGASATNFMSTFFDVTVWKDGRVFHDRYENGGLPVIELKNGELPSKKSASNETGTKIHFKADDSVLRVTEIDSDGLKLLLERVAYLNQGLKIIFDNQRDDEQKVFYAENGLFDYIKAVAVDENKKPKALLNTPFEVSGESQEAVKGGELFMALRVAFAFSKDDSGRVISFTNGIYNSLGGTHVSGFNKGLVDLIRYYYQEFKSEVDKKYKNQIEFINKVNKTDNVFSLLKPRDVNKYVYAIIDFKHEKPVLHPQTKDKLASTEATSVVHDIFYEQAMRYLDQNISVVHKIMGALIKQFYDDARDSEKNVKIDKKTEKAVVTKKLAASKGTDFKKNEIHLVEGDSAGGSVKKGRDATFQAVLPLRGKVLNVQKASVSDVFKNEELMSLITAFGCGIGSNYDESKLRYNKIIISTDQDKDGFHIRTLLLTFFIRFMPDLILNGHVYYLDTPLFVNTSKKGERFYTYSDHEQAEFAKDKRRKIVKVQRKKGLGELDYRSGEVNEVILNPETRRLVKLVVSDMDALYGLADQLMDKTNSMYRKELINLETVEADSYIDENGERVAETYDMFRYWLHEYGREVVEERALPDIRDGLKPVQRMILWEMLRSKLFSKGSYRKVAKIVGDVMGNWHPHGDSSIEEALTLLSQDFKKLEALVDVMGNNGSIFGDGAAAGRYIEARLTVIGDAYGKILKKGVVPYISNYDETLELPEILPAQLPYLFINGTDGVAYGYASHIPTHNPRDLVNTFLTYVKNPKATTKELIDVLGGPNFPSGGIIINKDDLPDIYETGQGIIRIRGRVCLDKKKNTIHIYEIPYTYSGQMDDLVDKIYNACNESTKKVKGKEQKVPAKVKGVNSVSNFSGKDGIDIAISVKRGVNLDAVVNELYAYTPLEDSYGCQFYGLDDKVLSLYSFKHYLASYLAFQHYITKNEFTVEMKKQEERIEILNGILRLRECIDQVVASSKASTGKVQLKEVLMTGLVLPDVAKDHTKKFCKVIEGFDFTERQAEYISMLEIYRINKMDYDKYEKELKKCERDWAYAKGFVESSVKRKNLIVKRHEAELKAMGDKPQLTDLVNIEPVRPSKMEVPEVDLYVSMDKYGYVELNEKHFDKAIKVSNKRRVGFVDKDGMIYNWYLERAKTNAKTFVNQLVTDIDKCVGYSTTIDSDKEHLGLFIFSDGHVRVADMRCYMTKSKATKVAKAVVKKDGIEVVKYLDIPDKTKTIVINDNVFAIEELTKGATGLGKLSLKKPLEFVEVEFK